MNTVFYITCALLLVHLAKLVKTFALYSLGYGFDLILFVYTLAWVVWTMALIVKLEELLLTVSVILRLAMRRARK